MPRLLFSFILLLAASLALPTTAQEYHAGDIVVSHPWARATVGTSRPAAVYLAIRNAGKTADELVSAETPIASRLEIHETKMTNGIMKMSVVPAVMLAPGERVTLSPGGYHIMMMGLKQQLDAGTQFPLKLTFKSGNTLDITVPVQAIGASDGGPGHESPHH